VDRFGPLAGARAISSPRTVRIAMPCSCGARRSRLIAFAVLAAEARQEVLRRAVPSLRQWNWNPSAVTGPPRPARAPRLRSEEDLQAGNASRRQSSRAPSANPPYGVLAVLSGATGRAARCNGVNGTSRRASGNTANGPRRRPPSPSRGQSRRRSPPSPRRARRRPAGPRNSVRCRDHPSRSERQRAAHRLDPVPPYESVAADRARRPSPRAGPPRDARTWIPPHRDRSLRSYGLFRNASRPSRLAARGMRQSGRKDGVYVARGLVCTSGQAVESSPGKPGSLPTREHPSAFGSPARESGGRSVGGRHHAAANHPGRRDSCATAEASARSEFLLAQQPQPETQPAPAAERARFEHKPLDRSARRADLSSGRR